MFVQRVSVIFLLSSPVFISLEVKEIFAVVKQHSCKESPEKNSEASMGFKPMTSAIPVQCSTNWVKPCWKQVKSEFNLYPLYEESERMCI